MTNRGQ